MSIEAGVAAATAAVSSSRKRTRSSPSTATRIPGFVQNCPTPSVIELRNPSAMELLRVASAPGSTKTGLQLLISANTGIGSGRAAAAVMSARPPDREPVKPTALTRGSLTSCTPMMLPSPWSIENTPGGTPQASTARRIAPATSSDVPGWPRWALTITGLPVHRALAVSPPATEKARGKLLEPKTTTGPSGSFMRRRSGRGKGCRSGWARSIRASTHDPSRAAAANRRSCPTVRPRSPVNRATGRAVSAAARSMSASPSARISSATRSRNAARSAPVIRANGPAAASAAARASSASIGRAR